MLTMEESEDQFQGRLYIIYVTGGGGVTAPIGLGTEFRSKNS